MPAVRQWHSRVALVQERCEPAARLLLENLRHDSLYRRVILALEKKPNRLSSRDIEDAVISTVIRRQHRLTSKQYWLGEWKKD